MEYAQLEFIDRGTKVLIHFTDGSRSKVFKNKLKAIIKMISYFNKGKLSYQEVCFLINDLRNSSLPISNAKPEDEAMQIIEFGDIVNCIFYNFGYVDDGGFDPNEGEDIPKQLVEFTLKDYPMS
jgi:hypothetical protein